MDSIITILSGFTHEVASLAVGAVVSFIYHKVKRIVTDVQCLWPRLRDAEKRLAALEAVNPSKPGEIACKNSSTVS